MQSNDTIGQSVAVQLATRSRKTEIPTINELAKLERESQEALWRQYAE